MGLAYDAMILKEVGIALADAHFPPLSADKQYRTCKHPVAALE